MSKINDRIQAVLKQHPQAKEVYATSDGQVFLNENRAILHAREAGKPNQPLRVETFKRKGGEPESADDGFLETEEQMVDELVEAILKDAATAYYEELVNQHGKENADELMAKANSNYEVRAKRVSEANSIEEVEELLKDESSKTVQKAGQARINELQKEAGEDSPETRNETI